MNEHYPFVNPPLPYAYDALEPYIDAKTMMLHHDRHLQTYVDNLNHILKDHPQLQNWSLEQLIYNYDTLAEPVKDPIRNNAGGVYNHIFYFNGMSNSPTRAQAGPLYSAIVKEFGTIQKFYDLFKQKALSVFGSGYAWLAVDSNGTLQIVTSANQDNPIVQDLCPIVGIDVWEHAYYLKHYNERAAYIDNWFQVVDWQRAGKLYSQCMASMAE
ncbi:MAG: superoxide dismutase [Oscillospiraceae bacterium]|jgi:Fe-Mn family superoxide dismutase